MKQAKLDQWASALIICGIPNELYWELTPEEVDALFRVKSKYDRALHEAAILRAGLVAATIVNVHRKKGARMVHPHDFLKRPRREKDYMSPEEGRAFMARWAAGINEDQRGGAE